MTREEATEYCEDYFNEFTETALCSLLPNINPDDYIEICIEDVMVVFL